MALFAIFAVCTRILIDRSSDFGDVEMLTDREE